MILEALTQSSPSEKINIVNIMMMLSLFLSLFASLLLLVTPFVIEKEQVQNGEEPPSLEVNKTISEFPDPTTTIEKEQVQNGEEPPSLEVNKTISEFPDPTTTEAPWANVVFPLAEAEHDVDTCRKVSMYVNFTELALSGKIIAPGGFDAHQCKGKCSSTQRKKFPNRSALMALLEKKKGIAIDDEACCVPTKLAPISALVFEKNGHIVLKKFEDLVVQECGCESPDLINLWQK